MSTLEERLDYIKLAKTRLARLTPEERAEINGRYERVKAEAEADRVLRNQWRRPSEGQPVSRPESILHQADNLIHGERRDQYGPPGEAFVVYAKMWGAYLGIELTPLDVINLMLLLKVARAKNGYHADSYLDIAGYSGLAQVISEERFEAYS